MFKNLTPIQKFILSFIGLIVCGTLLLLLPFSTYEGLSITDSLFTSTSAVCVTGLIVKDTAVDFTLFGKIIIIVLVQMGGLGIMTFSLGLLTLITGDLSIKWRFAFEGIYNDLQKIPIKSILIRILKYTFIIESITAAILYTQFSKDFPAAEAIGHSVFHAVSAFCNAGFSTFSNSLEGYSDNAIVNITIAGAIILGGLGFIVLNELARFKIKNESSRTAHLLDQLSIHTRLVLTVSGILVIAGTLTIFALEYNHLLKNAGIGESLLVSFFQSVTCRTAGFNTINIASLRESTHFFMIFLMFIGGSPGSIAGGIKTTTTGVIVLLIYSKLKGKSQIVIRGRGLDKETVDRSTNLIILSLVFISLATFLMLTIRDFDIGHSFVSILFECVSAFGTVGLSMGITGQLPDIERLLVSIVMLAGRLGPLTLIMAITARRKDIKVEYPTEHIMIG